MRLLLLLAFWLIARCSLGQTETDTIRPNPIKSELISSLSSSGLEVIDTLWQPTGFVLGSDENPEALAIPLDEKYLLFTLLPDNRGVVSRLERKEVNGLGPEELLVHWSESYGHSGMGGGLSERGSGFFIYDLQEMQCIFEADYYWLSMNWGNELDEEGNIVDTDVVKDCYQYQLKLTEKMIVLEPKASEDCGQAFMQGQPTQRYMLEDGAFIRKR